MSLRLPRAVVTAALATGVCAPLSCTDGSSGEATIFGRWDVVRYEDSADIEEYPQVEQDDESGCTHSRTRVMEVFDDLTATWTTRESATGCDDPSENYEDVSTSAFTLEERGPAEFLMTSGDWGWTADCELMGTSLTCVRDDDAIWSFAR